eukprot:8765043-Alexandrium_andersonii.AAC.1
MRTSTWRTRWATDPRRGGRRMLMAPRLVPETLQDQGGPGPSVRTVDSLPRPGARSATTSLMQLCLLSLRCQPVLRK